MDYSSDDFRTIAEDYYYKLRTTKTVRAPIEKAFSYYRYSD